jgi:hypothetical protein
MISFQSSIRLFYPGFHPPIFIVKNFFLYSKHRIIPCNYGITVYQFEIRQSQYRLFKNLFSETKEQMGRSVGLSPVCDSHRIVNSHVHANSQLQLLERGGDRYRNVVELNGDKNRMIALKSAITSVSGVTGVSTSDVSLLNSWIMHADMKKEDGAEFQSAILQLSGDTGLIRVLKIEQIAGEPWINIHDKYSTLFL